MKKKKKAILNHPAKPQAYVMPDEPEVTSDKLESMTEVEFEEWMRRGGQAPVGADGLNIEDSGAPELPSEFFDDNFEFDVSTDIEKAAAPLIQAAMESDFRTNVAHDPADNAVESESRPGDVAVKMLLLAVWQEVHAWKKQPSAVVIATALTLAIARTRGEKGVKHPRDLAKDAGVRVQTFFKVLNIAQAAIVRLALSEDLKKTGTYNQKCKGGS